MVLCSNVMAGTTTGTLTSTATVINKIVHTNITLPNGMVITKDLPKGTIINTINEKNNLIRINIIY